MSTVEKEQKGITRRDFVKGAAAGAVGGLVVGAGATALVMPKAEPKPWLPAKWDYEADVVIVDSADPAGDPTPVVMRILREGVGTKVIGLNLQDNTMCVYRGEQRVVKGVKDLVEAIEQPAAAGASGL